MLKLTLRRFALLGLAGLLSASTGVAVAQLTPTPAPPRQDTPRTDKTEPEDDSRAGGSLSQDTNAVEDADVPDGDAALGKERDPAAGAIREPSERDGTTDVEGGAFDPGDVQTRTFLGPVTRIGDGTITVKLGPPQVDVPTEQTFKITKDTPVIVDGKRGSLANIPKGSSIRVMALTGDPEVAARIIVATPPSERRLAREAAEGASDRPASAGNVGQATDEEDRDPHFDIYPGPQSAKTPPRRSDARVQRRPFGGEEAVLSLGIEVYGHGPSGALVTEMLATSPAADAGMLVGDLLVAVNRKAIPDPELIERLMATPDGTTPVELTVIRNGQQLQLAVSPWEVVDDGLMTPAAIRQAFVGHGIVDLDGVGGVVGTPGGTVGAAPLPFGVTGLTDFADGGVTIEGTADGLLGGLQPNDVVVGLNGQPVRNRDAFLESLRGLPNDARTFDLEVMRDGRRTTLDVPVDALGENFGPGTSTRRTSGPGVAGPGTSPDGTSVLPERPGRSGAAQPGATSEGRSDARQGGISAGRSEASEPGATSEGRSAAREGSISSGRSDAAPGNNLPGTPAPNDSRQQNSTGGQGGTGTGGTGTGGTGTGGTGTGGTGSPQ